MNTVREYRMPLLIAGGALVVAIILWLALISPQNSKLSVAPGPEHHAPGARRRRSRPAHRPAVRGPEALVQLRRPPEDQHPDPLGPEPDRRRRRGVQLREPVQRPGRHLGRHPRPVQRVHPGHDHGAAADHGARPRRPAGADDPAGVTAVPTTLTVRATTARSSSFVNGLDSFPRLFVIQKFILAYGAAAVGQRHRRVRRRPRRRSSTSSATVTGRHAAVGRWDADVAVGRSLQPGDHRVDLLHVDAQRPGRLHQGHRRPGGRPSNPHRRSGRPDRRCRPAGSGVRRSVRPR